MDRRFASIALLSIAAALAPSIGAAQGTAADYGRAATVAERTDGVVVDLAEMPHWIPGIRFWYRKSVKGGGVFVLVDGAAAQKRPAFDHEKVAAALSTAAKHSFTGTTLPFKTFTFVDSERAIGFSADETAGAAR